MKTPRHNLKEYPADYQTVTGTPLIRQLTNTDLPETNSGQAVQSGS